MERLQICSLSMLTNLGAVNLKSSAIAHSNIALIKYWGRSGVHDSGLNIPSNDSVSMTTLGVSDDIHLQTHTTIDFSDVYEKDTAFLEGAILTGRTMERVLKVINPLRKVVDVSHKFKMMSRSDFPIQAGLASSASGFAALAIAAVDALGIDFSKEEISTFARLGSGSAARSIHGGFVYWSQGSSHETSFARQICDLDGFGMSAVIAILHEGKKDVTSDVGHQSAHTSPFDRVRTSISQKQAKDIEKAILDDDFSEVGKISDESSRYMHAIMMTSDPPLFYWHPNTLKLIKLLQKTRESLECYSTVDAGPNVHCLCRQEDAYELQKILDETGYVEKTIAVRPADDSHVTKAHLF